MEAVSPRLLVWLGVLIVVLVIGYALSGPVGSLFWQTGPVEVTVNNSANVTHTFEVWVTEYPANVTVRESNGYEYTGDITTGLSTYGTSEYRTITAVELPDSARLHGRYVLEPGEMNRSEIHDFSSDHAVYVAIYRDDLVISRVSAHCPNNLPFLEVTMYHYGSGSAYFC